MLIDNLNDEKVILTELAERIKQYRISMQMTQAELADKAMVSLRSIGRFEKGEDITLSNLIKILKALGLAGNINTLVPDHEIRPAYYAGRNTKRQRAERKKDNSSDWKWGDET
ncbi:MAG: helix-turn-helix domain-containing protein [Clostridiales bacterium]|nr:helix-turn-helix domain-containing protein [Clostridiales bacterium]